MRDNPADTTDIRESRFRAVPARVRIADSELLHPPEYAAVRRTSPLTELERSLAMARGAARNLRR